jgi:uncharacterized phiE125 gp8 family phage protein
MYSPVLIAAPTALPVTLDEAKDALDIPYTDKDILIEGLIGAVTSSLDGWHGTLGGRCLCQQTWRQDFDEFASCLRLPLLPVLSAMIIYTDSDGVQQTVDDGDFSIREDKNGAYIQFVSGFTAPTLSSTVSPPLSVEFDAGYDPDGDVPLPVNAKQGILLLVRSLFDNPSGAVVGASVESLPFGPRALLMPLVRMNV